MGKPFASEMNLLEATFDWSMKFNIDPLVASIRRSRQPLLAVGSGGSFTTAHLAVALHNRQYKLPGIPATPLEATRSELNLAEMAVFLLSAGGKNPDILGVFNHLVRREPRRLTVMCATTKSKLGTAARQFSFADLCEFDLPAGRDGFLATNSLFSSGMLLARAYGQVGCQHLDIPESFDLLRGPRYGEIDFTSLLSRPTLLVLHPPALKTVAIEIESKFVEAALGNVQLADFRQFAHGRHHWLAKRSEESAVLAISTESDSADDTIRLLPKSVPTVVLQVPHEGPVACLSGILQVFEIVRQAGSILGIDPGDPGVPSFGRKLYNLNVYKRTNRITSSSLATPSVAVGRKWFGTAAEPLEIWKTAHKQFLDRLAATQIEGMVADYDGTLCDEAKRFDPLPRVISEELVRLLREGLAIGIATGRGQSVRAELRKAIPRNLWKRVTVGYYNGSDIGLLSDDRHPDGIASVKQPLQNAADLVRRLQPFLGIEAPELRHSQITLKSNAITVEQLWQRAQALLAPHLFPGITVLRSGHSVDILAPGVSKLAVFNRIRDDVGCRVDQILCIGDQGNWPGNDYELLGTPLSLSSNVVSVDPKRCWNIAPTGIRESQATALYIKLLKRARGGFRFRLPSLSRTQK